MEKIKLNLSKLEFKKEKIVVLANEDSLLLRGGASVPNAQCDGRTDIIIWAYYSQYFCQGPAP